MARPFLLSFIFYVLQITFYLRFSLVHKVNVKWYFLSKEIFDELTVSSCFDIVCSSNIYFDLFAFGLN
jgi:hypothetical protein